ncbi:Protein-arginine kinase McsB [Candidatus Syntrophocurvum alkaliphilum]|uniref:Protein-arginine kinase n=1 Tax=Candidatus Syntrophocurvum alkaliphilum TaxID=2293317 RepID=A0A6I6DDW3_9FIRM|nr:protein arginine kinase [Candidatus Syntrophocurvum alkaliphilum]QGU00745.1 Protein-arginine kinase McsB [Candidatus Syntrophocurvum alkaliphilum]
MSISDLINSTFVRWMDSSDNKSDIVVSSRVRLARNLRLLPFPHVINEEKGKNLIDSLKKAVEGENKSSFIDFDLITFDQLPLLDRQVLMEKHLTSPNHIQHNTSHRGLLVNNDGSVAIMVNEEDHIRTQCLLPGLQLDESYKRVQTIDDQLEKSIDYAFDDRIGYLTSCPTNVGTGMRASVMLHLPALTIGGHINRIFHNIGQFGMIVRGIYGEGTEALGNFYQLSNQITLGQSEEEIAHHLTTVCKQIEEQEKVMREQLKGQMKHQLEDKIGRSYGILTNAKVISSSEALMLLSDVRLGVDLGIIGEINRFALNELIVAIRPAHLQKKAGMEMAESDRDLKRAEVIKEKLEYENTK